MKTYILSILVTCCIASGSFAATVTVGAFGDQGWYSDDTRTTNGTNTTNNLVGTYYTHAGKPGQAATTADDAAIASQIQFVNDAPGNVDALKLSFGTGTAGGKATLSTINTDSGFATGNWQSGFFANLRRFRDTETNTTVKIGVQSINWAASQAGFTATRSGESAYDLTLTYVGNYTPFHVWENVSLTATSGTWKIYTQSGNTYYTAPSANKTLADWAADATWGQLLFGQGAKVSSIQIGAGSFGVASTAYVDYLETNLLNNGDRVEFIPEPCTMAVLGLGGLLIARKRK